MAEPAGIRSGHSWGGLRTSFVSLMSHRGVSIEEIARLAGHASTRTTEVVYRRELRPVITTGAEIINEVFGEASRSQHSRGRERQQLISSLQEIIGSQPATGDVAAQPPKRRIGS